MRGCSRHSTMVSSQRVAFGRWVSINWATPKCMVYGRKAICNWMLRGTPISGNLRCCGSGFTDATKTPKPDYQPSLGWSWGGWHLCIFIPQQSISIIYPCSIVGVYECINTSKLYNMFFSTHETVFPLNCGWFETYIFLRTDQPFASYFGIFWDVHQGTRVFDINRLAIFCERDKLRHKMREGLFRIMVRTRQAPATSHVRPGSLRSMPCHWSLPEPKWPFFLSGWPITSHNLSEN